MVSAPEIDIATAAWPNRSQQLSSNFTAKVTEIPPLPPGYEAYTPQVFSPPVVTYHVCRLCHRPRSDRYHRHHPITPSKIPPPPGICRRCRIKSHDDEDEPTKTTRISESQPVNIGIGGLLPHSLVSRAEMQDECRKRAMQVLAARRTSHDPPCKDDDSRMVYRRVASVETPELTGMIQPTTMTSKGPEHAEEEQPSNQMAAVKDSAVAEGPSKDRSASNQQVSSSQDATQSYSEAIIRQIARSEVERYRQAERRIEAHPEPYARGRLVPIRSQSKQETKTQIRQAKQTGAISVISHQQERDGTVERPTKHKYEHKTASSAHQKDVPAQSGLTYAQETGEERKTRLEAVYDSAPTSTLAEADTRPKGRVRHDTRSTISNKASEPSAAHNTTEERRTKPSSTAVQYDEVRARAKQVPRSSDRSRHRNTPHADSDVVVVEHRVEANRDLQAPRSPVREALRQTDQPRSRTKVREGRPRNLPADGACEDQDDQSSTWTDQLYWEDDRPVNAASHHSDTRYLSKRNPANDIRSDHLRSPAILGTYLADSDRADHPRQPHYDQQIEVEESRGGSWRERTTEEVYSHPQDEWVYRLHTIKPVHRHNMREEHHTERPGSTAGPESNRRRSTAEDEGGASRDHRTNQSPPTQHAAGVRFSSKVDFSSTPVASLNSPTPAERFSTQPSYERAEHRHAATANQRGDAGHTRNARHDYAVDCQLTKRCSTRDESLVSQHSSGVAERALRSQKPARDGYQIQGWTRERATQRDGAGIRHETSARQPRVEVVEWHGPYREDHSTDSMMALAGSGDSQNPPRLSVREI